MRESYWEGDLHYSPAEAVGQQDVMHRLDGEIFDIGTVEKVEHVGEREYWRAIDLDGKIFEPYLTKTLAARALTRKSYEH